MRLAGFFLDGRVLFLVGACFAGLAVQSYGAQQPRAAAESAVAPLNVWDGSFTEVQALRGAEVYRRSCGHCHRDDLRGNEGPPLVGVDFTYPWDGRAIVELFDLISENMPPASGDSVRPITRQETADIISHILRSNGLPAGRLELPVDRARLSTIRFTRLRPR
jgi:cytochrome c